MKLRKLIRECIQEVLAEAAPDAKVFIYEVSADRYDNYSVNGVQTSMTELQDLIAIKDSDEFDDFIGQLEKKSLKKKAFYQLGTCIDDNHKKIIWDLLSKKTVAYFCEEGTVGFSLVSMDAAKKEAVKVERASKYDDGLDEKKEEAPEEAPELTDLKKKLGDLNKATKKVPTDLKSKLASKIKKVQGDIDAYTEPKDAVAIKEHKTKK